jgi:hypothetical protein
MVDRTEARSEDQRVGRTGGHLEDRLVDRLVGQTVDCSEDLRAGHLEGRTEGRLEDPRAGQKVDRTEGWMGAAVVLPWSLVPALVGLQEVQVVPQVEDLGQAFHPRVAR